MQSKITVLKFGSSVLRSEGDLPRVVHEIYARWRRGSQVLVVVSALGETTNELLQQATTICADAHPRSLASLLATGEAMSASLLGIALDKAGIPVTILTPQQAGIRTKGDILDAELASVDTARLQKELRRSVVVLSGFVGVDENDDPTLLGRGGSDLTAIFLADQLGAECVLVKDVDGLYEADPHLSDSLPRRFRFANHRTLLASSDGLVQEKAVRYAESCDLEFSITAVGSNNATLIHNGPDVLSTNIITAHRAPLRVCILGCGTVGSGVFQALSQLPHAFEITAVADRNPEKAGSAGVPDRIFTSDPTEAIDRGCDVVVELFGGTTTTRTYVERALDLGRHVVTANKALISIAVEDLETIATKSGASLIYSAAVGGVMPAIEAVASERDLRAFSGIVNGTCNFICDDLANGKDFETALKSAQAAGYAEADPTLDITGIDAAQKLCILAREAFGVKLGIGDINITGVDGLDSVAIDGATSRGNVIRLIASCRRTDSGVDATVAPIEIPLDHPFAQVRGAENCLVLESIDGTTRYIRGRGAGRWPTTEAVLADLFDLRNIAPQTLSKSVAAGVFSFQAKEVFA